MRSRVKVLLCLFVPVYSFSYGQMEEYYYKRELKGISEQWHKIVLPHEIFGKLSDDLSNFRIFGITANNDTVEAPYLLRLTTEKVSDKEVAFKTINASHNDMGYYFTFEIPTTEPINQIKLDFNRQNFDRRIKLEGSHNQEEWFTIVDDYRILSIKNDAVDFQFTKLTFPSSKYRFYRLLVAGKEKLELSAATVSQHEVTNGVFKNYSIRKYDIKENEQSRQSEIDIDLELPVPLSHIKIVVKDTYDYYRPATIKYLADSFSTEQGWKYNYRTLSSGTLTSIEENEFHFNSITVQKLKIFIRNQDNQPLSIDTIKVKGYVHELAARFTEQGIYFLAYGNKSAAKPEYDLKHFTDKVPETLTALEVGEEQRIEKKKPPLTEPLFESKNWLWATMAVIILLLGGFSVKMIKGVKEEV